MSWEKNRDAAWRDKQRADTPKPKPVADVAIWADDNLVMPEGMKLVDAAEYAWMDDAITKLNIEDSIKRVQLMGASHVLGYGGRESDAQRQGRAIAAMEAALSASARTLEHWS